MEHKPYAVREPSTAEMPVLVSIPHTGTHVPEPVAADFASDYIRGLPMTDWHLHHLYDFLPALGITTVGVKWPNDLWREGRKVAGVLVETTRLSSGQVGAVIGIGLNVALPPAVQEAFSLSLNDLRDEAGQAPARGTVLGRLLNTLIPLLESFAQSGFSPFAETWMTHCVHRNRPVTLRHPDQTLSQGECIGLSPLGGLILRNPAGDSQTYHGGELSLRWEGT